MNQAFKNPKCLETLNNLDKAYNHCKRFKEARKNVRTKFIHLDIQLSSPYFLAQGCVTDLINADDAVKALIDKKLPYGFLHFLISDTTPRMRNAYTQYKKITQGTDIPKQEVLGLDQSLNKQLEKIPKTQGLNKKINIIGIKGAIDEIIENRIFSNRVRWLLLNSLEANTFITKEGWKEKKVSEILGKLFDNDMIIKTFLFDLNETPNISSYKIDKMVFFIDCLFISSAYSKACLLPDLQISLNKNVFPILSKDLLLETQKILIFEHKMKFDLKKISKYLRGTLETGTNKSFIFINSQNL